MRLLFALNSAAGGATLSAIDAMSELQRRGHTCYAVVDPTGDEGAMGLVRHACMDTIKVRMPWWNRKYRSLWYKRPVHLVREALTSGLHIGSIRRLACIYERWQIDVVHSNTSLTIHPALAAKYMGIPHVWHIRELVGNDALFRFCLPDRWLANTFLSLSDAVIANSKQTQRFFTRLNCDDRVEVVYNGIDNETFAHADNALEYRALWNISDDNILVGMIANVTSHMKRHDTFICMAATVLHSIPKARFVIVGYDPDTAGGGRREVLYSRRLKALAAEHGIQNHLIWAGKSDDIAGVMQALDIVVHPAGEESFGRVGAEAMAAGKPIVAAKEGGIGEVVTNNIAGLLVSENDTAGFANSVIRLIHDPELRLSLGAGGQLRAANLFTVSRMTDALEDIYRRVVKGRANANPMSQSPDRAARAESVTQ